jgi:hypothetical protein
MLAPKGLNSQVNVLLYCGSRGMQEKLFRVILMCLVMGLSRGVLAKDITKNVKLPPGYRAATLKASIREQLIDLKLIKSLINDGRGDEVCYKLRDMSMADGRPIADVWKRVSDLKGNDEFQALNFILPNGTILSADVVNDLLVSGMLEAGSTAICAEDQNGKMDGSSVLSAEFKVDLEKGIGANQRLLAVIYKNSGARNAKKAPIK